MEMATPMGPPVLPGYSLRVQLFSPLAYAPGDKPIRCFRVVTQAEATVREFCQEASRIHEINYGEPIAIKKVQDDQEFDITQSEILGHLFANTATIRVIQATANPSIRDSVPPSSALRFDPNITRKREREGSTRPNGVSPSSSWRPNKRQRVSEIDPDKPLPSRESDSERGTGRIPDDNVIPDSQDEGSSPRHFNPLHQVRLHPNLIPETPSPSPPPVLQPSPHLANGSADQQRTKTKNQSQNGVSSHAVEAQASNPLGQAPGRANSNGSQGAKSTSYHISRPTERGMSVSTAATSPFSVDQQTPTQNGLSPSSKRQKIIPPPKSRANANEDTLYDSIVSEDEVATRIRKKKSSLKMRNSPSNGLPGIDWANTKFNTPPNGTLRPSRSREGSSAGELPLTPNSKERKRQQEKCEADEARRARRAAAEAAEQRRLQVEEARQAEEARIAKEERAKREEQERLEVEEFQREEAKRKAIIAKAAQLQKERQEKEKKEAEDRQRLEQERIAREKAELERLAKKVEVDAKRLREEEEKEQKRQVEEADRMRKEKEQEELERQAAAKAAGKKSVSPEEQRQRHSSSPILPRRTPSSTPKPQSSTPYIPSGRKSALKSSLSSQILPSSSPSPPELSRAVGIESQMPLPQAKSNRKVSFDLHEQKETPIKPPTRIVPPTKSTPKASPSTVSAPAKSSQDLTPKAPQQRTRPPVNQSRTPIPVPSTLKRSSSERSLTPIGRPKAKITPPIRSASQTSETPIQSLAKVKSIETIIIESSSESDSEEDIPAVATPAKSTISTSLATEPALSKTVSAKTEQLDDGDDEDDEIDEDETQSRNSSIRDSRSPVVYSQHMKTEIVPLLRVPSPKSLSSSEEEDDNESSSEDEEEDNEATPRPSSEDVEMKDAEAEATDEFESEADATKATARADEVEDDKEEGGSSESSSESGDEDTEVQVLKSSPPILPASQLVKVSAPKPSQVNHSKISITPKIMSTQEEIDQQLTSSMYEVRSTANSSAVPSSSAIRPPPSFNAGPSLSKMAAGKQVLGSSATKSTTTGRSSQPARFSLDARSDSESEEESEEESEKESRFSDDEDDIPSKSMATFVAKKSQPQAIHSESSSDEESSEDEDTRTRKELLQKIAHFANGDSQISLPSPKPYKTSTQQEVVKIDKKGKKKIDKYLVGQKFRQPA